MGNPYFCYESHAILVIIGLTCTIVRNDWSEKRFIITLKSPVPSMGRATGSCGSILSSGSGSLGIMQDTSMLKIVSRLITLEAGGTS